MSRFRSQAEHHRLDSAHVTKSTAPGRALADSSPHSHLATAVAKTRDWLLEAQHSEGYWVGELEGDSILESEYILLLAFLGQERSEIALRCAEYLRKTQLPNGGWANYPSGPLEVSTSVKAYFALKLTGHDVKSEYMVRAREAIRAAGGAEQVNSFTRYYLALLGIISYQQCPAVPPELILIPRFLPFNIYEMSAWSRTIVVPLSLLWAYRPVRDMSSACSIDELFLGRPDQLPVSMPKADSRDALTQSTWINWDSVFRGIDRLIKLAETLRLRPLRSFAIHKAACWMIRRFEHSDGLGAIFPPIIWSVVALKCLGYADDSPEMQSQLHELRQLMLTDGESIRLQPCKSPVWDTAIATLALREAGVATDHPAIHKSVDWLLSKEHRTAGDWSVLNRGHEPGGWSFEFHNAFYPDVDDTSMVVMALCRCLPGRDDVSAATDFLLDQRNQSSDASPSAAIVSSRAESKTSAVNRVERGSAQMNAIHRGVKWVLAMQGRDGGWGAFDANNNRELFTRVPFADHNAMIDPSTADLTARMLEMFAEVDLDRHHPSSQRAEAFVWNEQESDGAWYGRWGVNYIYGTWQSLVGLTRRGVPTDDPRIQQAVHWLKSRQQSSGGWGESPRSYDDPSLRGCGEVTASQTAWAILGLLAAGEIDSDEVCRGIEYLLDSQNDDGTWDERQFTGTGFPKVFYLKYHLYRVYFPLMALARFQSMQRDGAETSDASNSLGAKRGHFTNRSDRVGH